MLIKHLWEEAHENEYLDWHKFRITNPSSNMVNGNAYELNQCFSALNAYKEYLNPETTVKKMNEHVDDPFDIKEILERLKYNGD